MLSNSELREEFEAREMDLLDTISMLSWHEEIGSKEKEKEIDMYDKKLKIEEISRLVGISKKEVQRIIDEANSEKLTLIK